MNRYIIGIFGRTGSGKSELAKRMIEQIPRVLIYDPMAEYKGVVVETATDAYDALKTLAELDRFRVVYRPQDDEDVEDFLLLVPRINDYTFVAEEITFLTHPHYMNPNISQIIKYGRHYGRSMIWITQRPAHTHKDLTSQANALITFRQTEPNDVNYLQAFSWDRDIQALKKYEYALNADDHGRSILQTLIQNRKK